MDFKLLKENWDLFGSTDALWSILTVPGMEGNRWDIEEFYATGPPEVDAVLGEAKRHGLEIKMGRACDFGCGVGRLTFPLASHFAEVDGVDVAASMIERAKGQAGRGPNVTFHLNERPDLTIFADSSFDFILTVIVLQHVEPRYAKGYLREFVRILKPGGLLIFQLPEAAPSSKAAVEAAPEPPLSPYRRFRRMFRFLRKIGPFKLPQSQEAKKPTGPVMEMHGIARAEVVKLIEAEGAKVVHTREDVAGGKEWPGWRYFVVKH